MDIRKLFGFKKTKQQDRTLERDVKYAFRHFFNEFKTDFNNLPSTFEMGLHEVIAVDKKDHVEVIVKMSRPGIFIGRKGVVIEAFKVYLERVCEKKVEIIIKDFDPLHFDWGTNFVYR